MALLVTAGVGFLQAAILFGRKAPLLVSLYANSGVETRLAVYGFLANFGARRFPKGERKALWCARRRIPIAPVGGLTHRLRREWWGCRPEWGSTFFRSERKYQRKHAARRLRRRPTSLRAVGFGLREPNGWTPRIYSGRPIPAVRPEQSDHVPWADCPQGLSSTSARCAHPLEKGFYCPF